MMSIKTEKLKKIINYYERYLKISKDDILFANWARKISKDSRSNVDKRVLVDCTHLSFTRWNMEFLFLLNTMKENHRVNLIGLSPTSELIWPSLSQKVLGIIKNYSPKEKFIKKNVFGIDENIKLKSVSDPKFFKKISSKSDLLNLKYREILIGDLVYDSYLKWYKTPQVDLKDKRLFKIINKCTNIIDQISIEFEKGKFDEIYLTHAVYIFYGSIARVALAKGITVYITQNNHGLQLHKLTNDHYLQTPDFTNYPSLFQASNDKNKLKVTAKNKLSTRFLGTIDNAISYMHKSAYSECHENLNLKLDQVNVIIMLHCFFDSPHIYKNMLFPDFYEWACYTIEACEKEKYTVYVKPHPNGLPGNDKIIKKLQQKYKNVVFLTPEISNNSILNAGFSAAFTVYGTLGHEFPFMGLPVINAGSNPHESYKFSLSPQTKNQFLSYIKKIKSGDLVSDINKEEILEFYAVHNLMNRPGKNCILEESFKNKIELKDQYKNMISILSDSFYKKIIQETKNVYIQINK